MGFPGGSVVKSPPLKAGATGMRVRSPGREDALEEEMATRSSVLGWEVPCTEGPRGGPWGHKEGDVTEQLCACTG